MCQGNGDVRAKASHPFADIRKNEEDMEMNGICETVDVQAEKKAMLDRLPAAWYDLSCRIKTILAVTESLPESVDRIRDGNLTEEEKRARLDQIYGLADAVCILLDLAAGDAERLERQLVSTDC